MKIFKTIFSISVFLLLIAGGSCNKRSYNLLKLDEIDSFIQQYPDSALDALKAIDFASLKEGEEKAKYGLLLTMAEDKNYLDPKNDSIISYASEYFSKKGDVLNQIKSDYYRGRVLYHRGEFPAALVSYFKAKDAAGNIKEYFWEGMSYRGISDVYVKVSATADELHYAKLEYESFKKSGVQPYLNYAIGDLARAYNNNGERQKTIDLTDQMIDSAKVYQDKYLYAEAIKLKSRNLFRQEKYQEAYPLLKQIYDSGRGNNVDSLYYCMMLIKFKDYAKANDLINEITDDKRPFKNFIKYNIYKEKGEFPQALEELEKFNNQKNEILRREADIDLAYNLSEYYDLKKEIMESQIEIQRYKNSFLIVLSFAVIIVLLVTIKFIVEKQRKELNKKIILLEQLEEIIRDSKTKNEKSDQIIRKLFGSQYSIIEESCEILYRTQDFSKAKRQISDHISGLISDLKIDGKGLGGFPANVISFLLQMPKVESVYNRKRHLKDKINKLDKTKSEAFLNFL